MGDAVTLIVLVAAGAARDPTTVAMTGATRDALGGAVVEVRETRGSPDDDAALAVETSAHADAVVELGWADPRHRQATLRLHIAAGGRWIERVIRFKPSDAYAERGRTLGFAVASMLPEAAADRPSPPATPPAVSPGTPAQTPPATPGGTPPPPPSEPPRPPASTAPAPPATVAAPPAPPAPPAPAPPSAQPTRTSDSAHVSSSAEAAGSPSAAPELALDLLALGSIGDSAEGIGGGAAGHWFVLRSLSVRLAGGVRAGSIDSAPKTSTLTLLGAAGVAWHPWRSTSSRPLGVSLRVDYLVEHRSATNPLSEPQHDRTPWISAADALLEAGWQLSADADIVLGLGLEDVFLTTTVHVQGVQTTVPALRAVAEGGLRLMF